MHIRNLPAVTPRYWVAILVASMCGANTGDFLSHNRGADGSDQSCPTSPPMISGSATSSPIWGWRSCSSVDQRRKRSAVRGCGAAHELITKLPASDTPYWVAMLTAGTLGTASGDWIAHNIGLGFGSAVLVVVFGVVLLAAGRVGGMSVSWYWASIVVARTAGTTLGDYLASRHGLDLELSISTSLTAGMLATAVLLWPHRRGVAGATAP